MKTVYHKDQPHLFDVPIDEIQTALDNECSWLNTIFGRCERLVKEINGNKYYTANWHKSGNDYVLVAPDEGLGNFCFFSLDEPTNLDTYFAGDVTRCNAGFSLILWCDLRTISTNRNTEAVKEEILQILNERTHLHSGRLSINKVYERAENVFREFDYNELDNQYNMHPFAAFRFEGELIVDTLCDAYIPPTPPTPVDNPYIKGYMNQTGGTFTFTMNGQTITVIVDGDGEWIYYPSAQIKTLVFTDSQPIENVILYKIEGATEIKVDYPVHATCIRCDESTESAIKYLYHIRGTATDNFNFTLTYVDENNIHTTVTETANIDDFGKWDVAYYEKKIYATTQTFYENDKVTSIELTENFDKCLALGNFNTGISGFRKCANLQSLSFPNAIFDKLTTESNTFRGNTSMIRLSMPKVTFVSLTIFNNPLLACESLIEFIVPENKTFLLNLNLKDSPLSYESMLRVAQWLADLSGGSARTVTFRKATFDALTAEQQSTLNSIIVTQKGWNLATA